MMRLLRNLYSAIAGLRLKLYQKSMVYLFNSIKSCRIDKGAVINRKSSFFDVCIGYGTYLAPNAKVNRTFIGKFCSIGPNLLCGFGIHPIDGISTNPSFYSTATPNGITFSKEEKIEGSKPIVIGNDVFIGANVTILDGVTIGDGAVIGAGAVVSKDIPPYAVAVGCPVRIVKYRFSPAVINRLLLAKWWEKDEVVFQKVERYFYDVEGFLEDLKAHD